MMNEIAASYDDFMAQSLNEAKHHKGQQEIAAMMREWVQAVNACFKERTSYTTRCIKRKSSNNKVQPYYYLRRCVPSITRSYFTYVTRRIDGSKVT